MKDQQLSREELYQMVWEEPLKTIASRFQISSAGFRDTCIKHQIPLPPVGYWTKVRFSKKIIKIPLGDGDNSKPIRLKECDKKYKRKQNREKEANELQNIELNLSRYTRPKKQLSTSHLLVSNTKKALKEEKGSKFNRYPWLLSAFGNGRLSVAVTKSSISKAMKFYQNFITTIESLDWRIITRNNHTFLVINDFEIELYLREAYKRVEKEKPEYSFDKYEYKATGIITFTIGGNILFSSKKFRDERKTLESQIPKMVMHVQKTVKKETKRKEEAAIERVRLENEKQRRLRETELKKGELLKYERLLDEAHRYQHSQMIRNYLAAISSNKNEEDSEWIDWIKEKVKWIDPFIDKEDPILGKYQSSKFKLET